MSSGERASDEEASLALRRHARHLEIARIRERGNPVRAIIEAFERGDDDLMGFPRHVVDFPAVYAAIDRHARKPKT